MATQLKFRATGYNDHGNGLMGVTLMPVIGSISLQAKADSIGQFKLGKEYIVNFEEVA